MTIEKSRGRSPGQIDRQFGKRAVMRVGDRKQSANYAFADAEHALDPQYSGKLGEDKLIASRQERFQDFCLNACQSALMVRILFCTVFDKFKVNIEWVLWKSSFSVSLKS